MVLLVLTIIAFVIGVGLVLGTYFGATKVPGMVLQRKLDARLQEISSPVDMVDADANEQGIRKTVASGVLPALDKMLGDTRKGSALAYWVEQSGLKTSVSTVLFFGALIGAAAGFGLFVLMRHPLAFLVGGAMGFAVPFLYLNVKRGRRMLKFEEEFPEALDLIARALKAGHAFSTGLKMVAD
jgi:tight adherence protein B